MRDPILGKSDEKYAIFYPHLLLGNSHGVYGRDDLIDRFSNPDRKFYGFQSVTIRGEGYLTGWQYFLRAVDVQCKDSSYVTVFGKRNGRLNYTHMATTHLRPNDPNKSGINYQFVQNVLIPVQPGDVIGLYTMDCIPEYSKHLVSATISGKTEQLKVNIWGPLIRTTPLHSFLSFDRLNWNVSLKAYTSGKNRSVLNSLAVISCSPLSTVFDDTFSKFCHLDLLNVV